uniref:39S ribosomal protein L30, mitochondrial n=1 Tax=Angiostrongylus costaricensis TaxID=334426 RepID=A0A0R3PLE7_ANGCS
LDFNFITHYFFDRWVYRPHGRWYRYLPRRNDSVKEFNYEAGGSLSEFKEEMASEPLQLHEEANISAPKLWMAWLYRDLSGEPYWTKKRVMKLFGTDFVVGRMDVFPNTSAFNEELWHIKHLIELKPITFPDGEPTSDDIMDLFHNRLQHSVIIILQWSPKELTSQLASKYYGCKDVFETNVYTNANISIVK